MHRKSLVLPVLVWSCIAISIDKPLRSGLQMPASDSSLVVLVLRLSQWPGASLAGPGAVTPAPAPAGPGGTVSDLAARGVDLTTPGLRASLTVLLSPGRGLRRRRQGPASGAADPAAGTDSDASDRPGASPDSSWRCH